VLSAALLAAAGLARPSAAASGPDAWTVISKPLGSNSDYPGTLRDSRGDVHVLYTVASSRRYQLFQAILSPPGALISDRSVSAGANSMSSDPQLIHAGAAYIVAVGADGLGSCSGQVCVTASADAFSGWSKPSPATTDNTAVEDSGFDAVFTTAGGRPEPVFAYSGVPSTAIIYHVGIGGPDRRFSSNDSGAFMTDVTLVVDRRTGDVWAGWYQHNRSPQPADGYYVREIYPAVGTLFKAPSSYASGYTVDMNSPRLPLAAPSTGGVYLAYCLGLEHETYDCGKVVLWSVGSRSAVPVPGTNAPNGPHSIARVALSAGPAGRLWVAWAWPNSDEYRATRTNIAKTKFGAVHSVAWPKGITGFADYALACEGAIGPLDLVAELNPRGVIDRLYEAQVRPGLSLRIMPGSWDSVHGATVSVKVTDVGDPVAGAKVVIAGKTATTSAAGIAKFAFAKGFKPGSYSVRASMTWYSSAGATMKVT